MAAEEKNQLVEVDGLDETTLSIEILIEHVTVELVLKVVEQPVKES